MTQLIRKRKMKNGLLTTILFLIVFYALWGFIYNKTIYGSKQLQYAHLIVVFTLSLFYVGKRNLGKLTNTSIVWIPYFVYTLGYLTYSLLFQSSKFVLFIEWYICLFMILIALRTPLMNYIPVKFIIWSGYFAIIGIAVQALFPNLYSSRIAGIFTNEDSIMGWFEHEYGLSGFTSQIAITARILIYGEIVLLFMKDILLPKRLQKITFFYLLVVIFMFCVLLTGKRLHFLIAVALPFIKPFLLEKRSAKKNFKLLIIMLLLLFIGELFISNIDYFLQTSTFRRLAETYVMAQEGEDITSGRIGLYEKAWNVFYEYPILGIGIDNYSSYTGASHYVHNTYIQVLCEQGLVGITLFICAIFMSIKNTIKLTKREIIKKNMSFLKISLGIQFFYIIYCFTGNEHNGAGLVMYFLAIAIIVSIENLNFKYRF